MEILQIIGIGVIATMLIVIIKVQKPEIALQLSIVTGIVVFVFIAGKMASVINLLDSFSKKSNIDITYISILLKIIGIAYLTEFGADICKDAGEGAIASKVELAGKIFIVVIAVPIITSLLDLIIKIMP